MAASIGAESERWCFVLIVVEPDGSLVLVVEPTRSLGVKWQRNVDVLRPTRAEARYVVLDGGCRCWTVARRAAVRERACLVWRTPLADLWLRP
jgi:hypothetical protein